MEAKVRSPRLARLLNPRSIAVFGGEPAARVVRNLERLGFDGAVYAVHPTRASIAGVATVADVAALPDSVDAVFLAVSRERCPGIVGALRERGAGGVVCYASGFAEVGDTASVALQRELLDAAGDMPFIGPNCYGLIHYANGFALWPDPVGGEGIGPTARGVALLSQSSNLMINLDLQQRGLPVAAVLTAGNQAQLGLVDLALEALEDPRISALGLYAESLGDVTQLERLALRSRELAKPVIMLKAGRSALAQAATRSHTASIAGNDAAVDALLARLGIARVASLDALLESLKLAHVHGALNGQERVGAQIVSMSCSGGEAALMADSAVGRYVEFAPFSNGARDALHAALGPLVHVANPLDYHTFAWGKPEALERIFAAAVSDGFDLAVLMLDFPRENSEEWWVSLEAFATALEGVDARGAVLSTLAENLPEPEARALLARGIVPLLGVDAGLAAIEAMARIGASWAAPLPEPLIAPGDHEAADRVVDEQRAKRELAEFGVHVPEGERVSTTDDAVAAALRLGLGLESAVAVKALNFAHKTEANAVRLSLRTPADVEAAAADLLGRSDALLVERMVDTPVAELLVGVQRVPGLGLMLTLGSGGVLVEIVADSACLLLPTDERAVRDALRALRCWRLVDGFRRAAAGSEDAAVAAVMAAARFAAAHAATLVELDINPLMITASDAVAADALLVVHQPTGERT